MDQRRFYSLMPLEHKSKNSRSRAYRCETGLLGPKWKILRQYERFGHNPPAHFSGRELYKQVHGDELVNFSWRTRPPVFLSEAKIKEIRKNLKVFSQEFEENEQLAFRRDVMKQFNAIREENYKLYLEEQCERAKLRGDLDLA
ncbi:eukaryotic translation initiation factor 3 subunit B [Ditylenchus destructor]|uniref:Eukaryotic translation initiation factor 3 subunit B n=1 Tax=Ditylenchus destructor TaxID=166010 RepID=A0AAD4MY40_9BILA|nr:eukaryotic translation initiation factor 3 subunit B [Ditylenchus destructor]